MYIRIQDNSIRYRVSKKEASNLIDGQSINSSISLSDDFSIKYSIETTTNDSQFLYQNNCMIFFVNINKLIEELEKKPSKKGIKIEHTTGSSIIILSLEIDLKNK